MAPGHLISNPGERIRAEDGVGVAVAVIEKSSK